MILRAALVASLLVAAGAAHAQQTGLACAFSAASDYTRQRYALFEAHPLFTSPSIELTLQKRRLKEDYCLRKTRCFLSDSKSFFFEQSFAGCVSEKD